MCVMAPRVHQVAARQKTRRAAGIEIASRRKNFIVPPYMLGCVGQGPERVRQCRIQVWRARWKWQAMGGDRLPEASGDRSQEP